MPKLAFLFTSGVEQAELLDPLNFFQDLNFECDLIAPSDQEQTVNLYQDDKPTSDIITIDIDLEDAVPEEYYALILPGGVVNSDHLRQNQQAVKFITACSENNIPIAAICHAPWLLIEANLVEGCTLTSYPSLKTDIINAGGEWVDSEVVNYNNIVTSRTPEDIPVFCKTLQAQLEQQHILI